MELKEQLKEIISREINVTLTVGEVTSIKTGLAGFRHIPAVERLYKELNALAGEVVSTEEYKLLVLNGAETLEAMYPEGFQADAADRAVSSTLAKVVAEEMAEDLGLCKNQS